MLTKHFFETTRGRIVALLRRGPSSVDDLSSELGLTANAVRAHITAMQRDGVVRRVGQRAGTSRPSHLFGLTAEVEQLLSRAYLPLMTQFVQVFTASLPRRQVERLMREAGAAVGAQLTAGKMPPGRLAARVRAASDLMNQELGAVTHVEENGQLIIRGSACPLSALTGKHPAVCLAMESLLSTTIGADVRECCERSGCPQCCFKVHRSTAETRFSPRRSGPRAGRAAR